MNAVVDPDRTEKMVDKLVAQNTQINAGLGGVKFETLLQLMDLAKLMAASGAAVPMHLRGHPGTCLAICTKAMTFGFDPFALAEHSYVMVKSQKVDGHWTDVETIAYDSFVIHAIIEAHGDVTGKLIPSYEGEGEERTCTCTGIVDGKPLTVTSATLGEIKKRIGRNDKGKLKGSPLWESKPDQQLWYDTRRDWCRAYQPHILLGWYDKDEIQEHGAGRAKDVTPAKPQISDLKSRLQGQQGRGFNAEHVERETTKKAGDEPDAPALGTAPAAATENSSEKDSMSIESGESVTADAASSPQPETSSEGGPHPGPDEAVEEVDGSQGPDASLGQDMPSASSTLTLGDYERSLAAAAEKGTEALSAEWAAVPAAMKKSLKSALDRRFKPRAAAVDETGG